MSETTTSNNDLPKLSDSWKARFEILERLGAGEKSAFAFYKTMGSPEYKALSFKEKQIFFNKLAVVFGPFYYFSKKMWLKGAMLLGVGLVLVSLIELIASIFRFSLPFGSYYVVANMTCSFIANYDYYRHVKHGEKIWPGLPEILSKPIGVIGVPLGAAIIFVLVSFRAPTVPSCESSEIIKLASKLITGLPIVKASGAQYVTVKDINELGYNKESKIRLCSGTLVTTVGDDAIEYSIKQIKSQYYVEVQIVN